MPGAGGDVRATLMRGKSSARLWVFEVRDGSNVVYVEVDAREAFNSVEARMWSEQKNGERSRMAAEKWAAERAVEQGRVQFRTDGARR